MTGYPADRSSFQDPVTHSSCRFPRNPSIPWFNSSCQHGCLELDLSATGFAVRGLQAGRSAAGYSWEVEVCDPIPGVWVGMFSAAFRMRGNFAWVKRSSEEPYREIPQLPELDLSGKTDSTGTLVIRNIPGRTRGLSVDHPQFQVPLQDPGAWRDRYLREMFLPGVTNKLTLTRDPKGTDFIGTSR